MDKFTQNMTPPQLIEIILDSTNNLVDLYEREGGIRDLRVKIKRAHLNMLEKEEDVRGEIFEAEKPIQASRQRDYIKWQVSPIERVYEGMKHDLYILNEERDMLIELINSSKAALKVMDMEAKSLHYGT